MTNEKPGPHGPGPNDQLHEVTSYPATDQQSPEADASGTYADDNRFQEAMQTHGRTEASAPTPGTMASGAYPRTENECHESETILDHETYATDWRNMGGFRVRTVVHAGPPSPQADEYFRKVVVGFVKPTLLQYGGSK